MNSDEIIKLLETLIGSTEGIGDSSCDNRIEVNLKKLIDVMNWGFDEMERSSKTRHRDEYSMRKIGETAFSAMCEWRDWLSSVIENEG